MDFCKGRIAKNTLQIPLEAPKILPFWISSVHTPERERETEAVTETETDFQRQTDSQAGRRTDRFSKTGRQTFKYDFEWHSNVLLMGAF